MRAAGYAEGLKAAGYSCQETKAAGYTPQQCCAARFSLEEGKAAGYMGGYSGDWFQMCGQEAWQYGTEDGKAHEDFTRW